ncbi:MAG: nitrogen fixation protein NifQ [Coriobacteriia bacterium]|nr:nitrogen fixation protein NifQ [Coriobacteriia bacterium]
MAEMPTVHDPSASGEAMPTGSSVSAVGDLEVAAAVERFSDGAVEARFAEQVEERRVEFDAIVGMLLLQTTPGVNPAQAEVVARAIAAACLGEQHLWRDLELPNRGVLRRLFEAYFEPFAADNLMDMRWKKFLYRKLCRWGGFHTCKAPSCGACSSYSECFGTQA